MKEGIGLFFGRQHVAQFIEAEDRNFRIEIDKGIEILSFGEFGGEIEERDKDGLIAFKYRVVADGRGKVGFADPGRTDEDEVGGFFEPVGMKELHDLIPWEFRVKGAVKVLKELDPFDPGGSHQVLDSLFLPELILFMEESF